MRNINLVPKVPYLQKRFIPIALVGTAFFVCISVILFSFHFVADSGTSSSQMQIASLQSQLQLLSKQREADPLSADFEAFSTEISKLKSARKNWVPVMELLSASLPQAARLTSSETGQENSVSGGQVGGSGPASLGANQLLANFDFAEMNQVINYIVLLEQSPLIEKVTVTSASRRMQNSPQKPSASAPSAQGGAPSSGVNGGGQQQSQVDQLTKALENRLKPVQNEGDELLNELRWMIGQQVMEKESGIKVPDKPYQAPNGQKLQPQSPISPEEYTAMKQQYEQNKQLAISTGSNGAVPPKIEAPSQAQAVTIYQVALQITLKAPAKEK